MGLIAHGGILYGGGSDVEANPTGSATDTIEKIGIDGTVYEVTDADAVHTSDIGTANGVAELDANGLVPSSQLPSYVDDVLEYASVSAFPATGETGKIYVALDTNLTYRWSGSAYVEISPSLALGETSSTAYRGDRGKTAYDHATESGRSGAKSAGLYKIGVTAQGHVASATAVAKADLTALGLADQNDVDAIEEDIEGYKTVTGKYITITDGAELPAKAYSLALSPVQSLNGYDSPWVGGAGKNLFDGSQINAWNNSNGLTITKNDDGSFVLNGTATATAYQTIPIHLPAGRYVLSGCPSGGSPTGYSIFMGSPINQYDTGDGVEFTVSEEADYNVIIPRVINGTVCNNLLFKPMICLSSAANPTTFAPYSNICPIHGADEVGVRVCGKNLFDQTEWQYYNVSRRTYGTNCTPLANLLNSLPTGKYTISAKFKVDTVDSQEMTRDYGFYITTTGAYNIDSYTRIPNPSVGSVYSASITVNKSSADMVFNAVYLYAGRPQVTDTATIYDMQLEIGETATDFEPYNLHSTTIILPSTVYGGSVEQGGSGSVTMANIASYNGETINEPWISSMDKYEAGATPTTGAQVVYPLTTPTALSVTPFTVELLEGVNNVWAECKENSTVIDNAQQSLSYQPENIVGQLRQEIEAKPDSFAQLSDTSFSNLANGQIPKWNSTSQKWENANESGGGGASSLADLSDTNISSPADGQILKWDGPTSKWVNANEYSYTLPAADANTLGGVKVGSRLSIDANGVLSANDQSYTLPTASASTKGGIKVGDNLSMNGEVLSAKTVPWTSLGILYNGNSVELPSDYEDLLVCLEFLDVDDFKKCSYVFNKNVVDFDPSYTYKPTLKMAIHAYSSTFYYASLACSYTNNKKMLNCTTTYNSLAVLIYYR